MNTLPAEFIITDPVSNKKKHYKINIYGDYSVKINDNNGETIKIQSAQSVAQDYDYCSSLWQDYVVENIW